MQDKITNNAVFALVDGSYFHSDQASKLHAAVSRITFYITFFNGTMVGNYYIVDFGKTGLNSVIVKFVPAVSIHL